MANSDQMHEGLQEIIHVTKESLSPMGEELKNRVFFNAVSYFVTNEVDANANFSIHQAINQEITNSLNRLNRSEKLQLLAHIQPKIR